MKTEMLPCGSCALASNPIVITEFEYELDPPFKPVWRCTQCQRAISEIEYDKLKQKKGKKK